MLRKLTFKQTLTILMLPALLAASFITTSDAHADEGVKMQLLNGNEGEALLQQATSTKGTTTNVELGAGIVGTKKFTVNQKNVRDAALTAVISLRKEALGDSSIKFDGKTIKDYLSANKISESTYLNPKWSNALERIAVQRAIEAGDSSLGSKRPNGDAWNMATYGGIQSDFELRTYSDAYSGYTIANALSTWASQKAEYVKECKGQSHDDTSNYVALVNPANNAYGFALADAYDRVKVAVGEVGTDLNGSKEDATNWVGSYSFDMSISNELASKPGVNVNLFAGVARINIGETYTFTGTLAYRNATFTIKDSWYTSDSSVLKVETSGKASALKAGTADVYLLGKDNKRVGFTITVPELREMYRFYNQWTGEHFYTAGATERDNIAASGWRYEGVEWNAPNSSKTPVYRLYNKYAGDHHFTMDKAEYDSLEKVGWTKEGIGWYSDDNKGVKVYRQYNPYAVAGTHNYTTNINENNNLIKMGWRGEGIGWYGLKATTS